MTMRQVLDTSLAAFEDPAIGIKVQVGALIALGAPPISDQFRFAKWAVRTRLKDARTHSLVVRPGQGADQTKLQQTLERDGIQVIEVATECFDADLERLQDKLTVVQSAMLLVLDRLVDFSGGTGGTIYEVIDPVTTDYGEFDGTPSGTSAGFVSRITLNERSAQ
jgi:hypothetical protein